MKTPLNGNMIAFIQKNKGMGFALSICLTNAKPEIKQKREQIGSYPNCSLFFLIFSLELCCFYLSIS